MKIVESTDSWQRRINTVLEKEIKNAGFDYWYPMLNVYDASIKSEEPFIVKWIKVNKKILWFRYQKTKVKVIARFICNPYWNTIELKIENFNYIDKCKEIAINSEKTLSISITVEV